MTLAGAARRMIGRVFLEPLQGCRYLSHTTLRGLVPQPRWVAPFVPRFSNGPTLQTPQTPQVQRHQHRVSLLHFALSDPPNRVNRLSTNLAPPASHVAESPSAHPHRSCPCQIRVVSSRCCALPSNDRLTTARCSILSALSARFFVALLLATSPPFRGAALSTHPSFLLTAHDGCGERLGRRLGGDNRHHPKRARRFDSSAHFSA
jgi:hypothetical protein